MKISFSLSIIVSAAVCLSASGQGTFVFDQQSSATDQPPLGILYPIQSYQPFGQSFVPSLSSIDFVRLFIYPGGPIYPDATVYVNLLSGSVTGTVMAATAPLTLHSSFSGVTNFLFATSVPLTPGMTYYLQPVASTDSTSANASAGFTYPNGNLFLSGVPAASDELWFREGIVVPEPSSGLLFCPASVLGCGGRLVAEFIFSSRSTQPLQSLNTQ